MNKSTNMQRQEKHQILPDYNMEMDSSSHFDSDGSDSDLMAGFYGDEKDNAPPPKPLQKTKKLRVLVKRLSQDVVHRYLKKKNGPKVGSAITISNRPIHRPIQKTIKQQMIMNKPPQEIRKIVKSVTSPPSADVFNLLRNNFKQQSLAGQKLSGVFNRGSPAIIKPQSYRQTTLNKSNVTIRHIRRPLQSESTKISPIKLHETTGFGNTKGPSSSSSVKNVSAVDVQSKNVIEMRRDTIQVKREVKRTALTDFLSNFENDDNASVDVKSKVIVRSAESSKSHEIISKNTINLKKVVNTSMVMGKQPVMAKKDFTIATSGPKTQSVRGMEWLKNKEITLRETNKLQGDKRHNMNFPSIEKKEVNKVSAAAAVKAVETNAIDKNANREMVRKSIKLNQSSTNTPSTMGLPKIVKQPKMVKVPISKLIKIPQGITISKTADKPGVVAKALNSVKNFETVNMANVVKNSDIASAVKMPESYKLTKSVTKSPEAINPPKVINIPKSIKISKVLKSPDTLKIVKLPNTQNLTAVKLLDSNAVKVPETVILSKVVKMPEVDTATSGNSNLRLSSFYQSQYTQTEADGRNTNKNALVKRHTKAVQTKFTCNDNICGIIDTAEFNINCFYCYDVFPLRKWSAFIRHMKSSHRMEERSLTVADSLLIPKNIIPYGMKSKEVQVNTLRGRNVLGGKRKLDAPETFVINNNTTMDDMENMYDDSQMENDLEIALNCLDEEEGDMASFKSNSSQSNKVVILENEGKPHKVPVNETKTEDIPQTSIKTMSELNAKPSDSQPSTASKGVVVSPKTGLAAGNGIKITDHPFFKNKIIQLPSNIKIIKKLPNCETSGEATKSIIPSGSSEHLPDSSLSKIVVVKKLIKPLTTIKIEDAAESQTHNTTMESIDSFSGDIALQSIITKTEDTDIEFCESRLDDTCESIKNDSLDISKTDVEQNVKIEPDFDNESADETALLRSKDEAKRRKKYMNSRKTTPQQTAPKPRPIPSNLLDSDDEMPSNDENEDEFPSPTNGCGILFGLTNRNIVTEFIRELQKHPELWQFNRNSDATINYNESIRQLYQHINDKFNMEMTDFEVRLSVQRIKYWYCRTLQKMEKHNKNNSPTNQVPFRQTFPEYFNLLKKFLSYDSNCTKDLVLGKRFQKKDVNELNRYPKWMLYKEPGGGIAGAASKATNNDICTLARDLAFSEDGDTDQDEEEGHIRSLKPFKSELDTSAAPPDPFICDICFVDFNSMVELTRHRLKHFPPQYPCASCKRMHYTSYAASKCCHDGTNREISTKQHPPPPPTPKEVEQGPTQYVCEICGVSYKSLGTLNYHKKDKHFNMRHKCPVCKFTSISNYRMLQHQKKRHVAEFGTCEEIAKKTRSRTDTKIPFNAEARREYEWRREMRKKTKPGELFYGCYKCKLVFNSRKDKVQHNRVEHPITEATVLCLLCKKEKALFSNSNSVRRHYTDVHKVGWDEIDDLVKRTKPLFQTLSPLEVDQLKSSDNPCDFVVRILNKKLKAEQQHTGDIECEISKAIKSLSEDIEEELNHTYDPFKFESSSSQQRQLKVESILLSHDEDSMEDDYYYQSSFFNDIGIDHDYDDMQDDSYNEDDDDDCYDLNPGQQYEYQDDDGNEHYIIEEACIEDEEYADIDVGLPGTQQLIYADGVLENTKNEEEIVEEIVEYDFMEDVMDDHY